MLSKRYNNSIVQISMIVVISIVQFIIIIWTISFGTYTSSTGSRNSRFLLPTYNVSMISNVYAWTTNTRIISTGTTRTFYQSFNTRTTFTPPTTTNTIHPYLYKRMITCYNSKRKKSYNKDRTSTTTSRRITYTKQQQQQQQQQQHDDDSDDDDNDDKNHKILYELQNCITIYDIYDTIQQYIFVLQQKDLETFTDNNKYIIFDTDGIISSYILIRFSKLYINYDNQYNHNSNINSTIVLLPSSSSSSSSMSTTSTTTVINQTNTTGISTGTFIEVISTIINHFLQTTTTKLLLVNTNSNHCCNDNYITKKDIDRIVDTTKACAVLSRLLLIPIPKSNNNNYNNDLFNIFTKPFIHFYTNHGTILLQFMQPYHISGTKWALDCFFLHNNNDDNQLSSSSENTIDTNKTTNPNHDETIVHFPKSIFDAYNQLQLPFCILPGCFKSSYNHNYYRTRTNTTTTTVTSTINIPNITIQQLISEVDFRSEDIYTTTSNVSVQERRYTAWQGDVHVPNFIYSGKSMIRNDWTPLVRQIRDVLYNITYQYYDGCLLNLYINGTSGMRYHSDPDQGTIWDNDTAVVSVGTSRRFTFRSTNTNNNNNNNKQNTQRQEQPHSFIVMDGDVTYMYNNCQYEYQHSVKNADNKNETSSRISLVYKRTLSLHDNKNK